ncbi:PD40 domain-containing protein [Muricauda sp. CAU 1633]|uniref:PD40 domain-containing protein n=1 Tax=Allomuricauda sp. CAU 1633 TaxID=2816036 RepID=UPI001A8E2ED7|nr:PD40 domain-containing protein [Muricauda sp. CAU 1633]MBO0323336.1 PD40 domain-containing protein [Muricauda sp. CAU 1633]
MKTSFFFVFSICTLFGFGQNEIVVSPAVEVLRDFDKVRDFTLDDSGSEAYFTIQSQTEDVSVISTATKTGDAWGTPLIAPFSGTYKDMEPFLSPDGLRLYFVSNRPLHDSISTTKDYDIWYVERFSKTAAWSKPINMGSLINTEHNEFYPAVAENGNFYYTGDRPDSKGEDDIFFSEFKNGTYTDPISLDENINSKTFEYNAYISKDDSYLIFGGYNREDGQGSGDLYISFKNAFGEWSKAKPLPQPINSKQMDYCPFVDEKNNILYFTSRRITNPDGPIRNMQSLKLFLNSYENGNSRLYKTNIDVLKLQP